MQRWFYANEELFCELSRGEPHTPDEFSKSEEDFPPPMKLRRRRFCVKIKDRELMPNEALAVTGNCEQLGNWQFEDCVLMIPEKENENNKWHAYVDIPENFAVEYRYLIVAVDKQQMIVRFFESHLQPRILEAQTDSCVVDVCEDVFGDVNNQKKVERGWLTSEQILQLMFFKAPFEWQVETLTDHLIYIKVTPVFRKNFGDCFLMDDNAQLGTLTLSSELDEQSEDEISQFSKEHAQMKQKDKVPFPCGKTIPSYTQLDLGEERDEVIKQKLANMGTKLIVSENELQTTPKETNENHNLSTAFAFNEVFNANKDYDIIKPQSANGTSCGVNDLVIFHLTIGDFQNTVYLVELFTHSKNAADDEGPYLIGYRYFMPEDFENLSQGYIEAPIICASKHRPIGSMKFRFLLIRPVANVKFDLSVSHLRNWSPKPDALHIGHRGQGKTYRSSNGNMVLENTIYSIREAIKNGADMIEFDVHLTMDLIPIINHDFNVYVSSRNSLILNDHDNVALPIGKLTYAELLNLKLSKSTTQLPLHSNTTRIGDAPEPQQLFPPLSDVLDAVDEDIAFDVEIKWPQQFCNGNWEENVRPKINRNLFIDRILQVIMKKVKKRLVVLSCFEADMCSLLRFKQNRFPVMFLQPPMDKMPYLDARSNSFHTAVNFAYGFELLGVIPHASTLLCSPTLIGESRSRQLIVFCYGVTGRKAVEDLKDAGVAAVILDRIDKLGNAISPEYLCPCCEQKNDNEIEDENKNDNESESEQKKYGIKAGGDVIKMQSFDSGKY